MRCAVLCLPSRIMLARDVYKRQGVDSEQKWQYEFGSYGEMETEMTRRRMKFLQALPILTRDRFKAMDRCV